MTQLRGIAAQRLAGGSGYGFAGEGELEDSALVRAMKVMGAGLPGGNSFMEDYTYHFEPGNNLVLGAHMLEICESIADGKPSCEIHPLGIGGKADPVRNWSSTSAAGPAPQCALHRRHGQPLPADRQRSAGASPPAHPLPKLPVARVLWQPYPDMRTGCSAWVIS